VWRLAERHALGGWVRNRDGVVEIVVEGDETDLDRFGAELARRPPRLARIDRICTASTPPLDRRAFTVDGSAADGGRAEAAGGRRLVAPDAATCDECRRELADPADRRHGYPFVNCTDCGPRFTIIDDLPYDRSRTSMAAFPLCPACAREYEDPTDRRFHAEPVACPDCGPRVRLVDRDAHPLGPDAIEGAAKRLRAGGIVALKGLGGYQLACDATDEDAVAELRRRKRRPHKPLAVMMADLAAAHRIAHLDDGDVALLTSVAAPIVLVRTRARGPGGLAPSIAPGHLRVGLLLPTTPLHHLLLAAAGRPLVMTSGNRTDEPIAVDDGDARRRLAEVADAFLVHDRRIACRYDDSVARVRRDGPALLRRARGYAPAPVGLPVDVAPTLAVGAELHATFCLASGRDAFLSPHIGDLDSDDAVAAFEQSLAHHRRLLRIEPRVVAHDLHPDLASTRIAEALGLPRVAVQHHHAHVAAVMAEHGLRDAVLGVAFDGFGLGTDGSGWGGELLVCDWAGSERVGHLRVVRQPGGDAAVRRPARMAVAHAHDAGRLGDALTLLALAPDEPDDRLTGATARLLTDQVDAGFLAPPTSSAGRLFDAVAALTGICTEPTYEGQPAMLLEQAATAADPAAAAAAAYSVELGDSDGRLVIDTRPLVGGVIDDLLAGADAGTVARRFHDWLATAVVEAGRVLTARHGLSRVCLAGGVFANDVLVEAIGAGLDGTPLRAYAARAVPPGDGGLALGQILVAHAHAHGGG
jgi:hydrogenase maturation protein HypF